MRGVPDDQPTQPDHDQPTVDRDQATPPGGTPVIGQDATQEAQVPPPPPPPPGFETTRAHDVPPPPPPPPGDEHDFDDQPTTVGRAEVGDDQATTVSQPQSDDRDQTTQAAVIDEPNLSKGSGDMEDYQWHTGRRRESSAESDAVEFIDVKKTFGRNTVLNGLNLGLPDGQISMILGPSGTGKSVCIKHMVGLLYPDEGDVLVHGESVPNMADDDLFDMRKKFGVLFQDGALFGSMNLWDNVAFPLRQHTDKAEDEIEEIVSRRLREVGLEGAHDKMPNELSGGMRKRAGFARALVLDPDIVLFDEPDSGLDPVRTALLGELIQEIHAELMQERQGKRPHMPAFCLITHDIMT